MFRSGIAVVSADILDNAPAAVCLAQFDTYLSQLKHWKEKE